MRPNQSDDISQAEVENHAEILQIQFAQELMELVDEVDAVFQNSPMHELMVGDILAMLKRAVGGVSKEGVEGLTAWYKARSLPEAKAEKEDDH